MNEINTAVLGTTTTATLRKYAEQTPRSSTAKRSTTHDDQVEISEVASLLNRLADLPEERARKIIDIRNAISRNEYLTADKLDVATERLLLHL